MPTSTIGFAAVADGTDPDVTTSLSVTSAIIGGYAPVRGWSWLCPTTDHNRGATARPRGRKTFKRNKRAQARARR